MKPIDCPKCKEECCNPNLHELRNAEISLAWVADQFERGYWKPYLVQRMKEQVERISKALKMCKRNNDKD